MTDQDRIDFLQGQVQALLAFSFALIETHPNFAALNTLLPTLLEGALAKHSGSAAPDALIDGLQDMQTRLVEYVAKKALRQ